VFVVTFDEWGGFYDHVPPPRVVDDTDPSTVDHTGDGTTPTEGRLIPDYRQLGFRVPAIVVSNLAPARVVHHGPFEHASTLKLIESTFGLHPLTARDAHAQDLGQVLGTRPHRPVPAGASPTSSQVPGPADDATAVCSASSVQSVSPPPQRRHGRPLPYAPVLNSESPSGAGMVAFGRQLRADQSE
jgi:phospholipase C